MNVSARGDGIRLLIRVAPKSGRDAIEGWQHDANGKSMLKLRVAAAPEDGAANASLVVLLAKALGVRKSAVTILRGAASRNKQVHIEGNGATLAARLKTIGRAA